MTYAPDMTGSAGLSSEVSQDIYATGLVNAHALEKQATQLINRQLERLDSYPEIAAAIRQHLTETENQIDRLQGLMDDVGTSSSAFKDLATSLVGNVAAVAHTVMPDEVIKNHLANCAFETSEIATYRSLIAMARATGHDDHVATLQLSLSEEEATHDKLLGMTEAVTLKFLSLSEEGAGAKR